MEKAEKKKKEGKLWRDWERRVPRILRFPVTSELKGRRY